MMNGFSMSFGFLWLIFPIAVLVIGAPLVRRLVHRYRRDEHLDDERGGEDGYRGSGQLPAAGTITDAVIYRLAKRLNGRLTVSDVVIETGLGTEDAEQLLRSLTDSLRVRMEVSDDGVVVYEFVELMESPSPSGPDA